MLKKGGGSFSQIRVHFLFFSILCKLSSGRNNMSYLSIFFGTFVCFMVQSGLACSCLDAQSAKEMLWWDSKGQP